MTTKPLTDDVSALTRLREKLAGMTPGPWSMSGVRGKIIDGKRTLAFHHVGPDGGEQVAAVWYDPETHAGFADAKGIVHAVSLARFVADEGTVAKVTQMVEQSVWSPASGPVSWTDEKIEAAREQAAYLARVILSLIASAGEEA